MNVCGQGGKISKVDRGLHCKTGGGGANEKSGKKEFLPNGWLFFKEASGRRGGGPAREHGRGHQGPRGDPSSFQDVLRLSDVGASSHLLASDASPAS